MPKKKTSFALSQEALDNIAALAKAHGLSQASVVEMAVRALVRMHDLRGAVPEPEGRS